MTRTLLHRVLLGGVVVCLSLTGPLLGQEPPAKSNPFDQPRLEAVQAAQMAQGVAFLQQGKFDEAENKLRDCLKRRPDDAQAHYNLACTLARKGDAESALASLAQAVEFGFRDSKHINADQDLLSLHDAKEFRRIIEASKIKRPPPKNRAELTPAVASNGEIKIGPQNVAWERYSASPRKLFRVRTEIGDEQKAKSVADGLGEIGELLRSWHAAGTAAGNYGDLYDNHDSDHSNMNFRSLPQLTRVEFSDDAKKRQLHHGLQRYFYYDAVTIGNSSTAITSGPFWRCQGRLALTQAGMADVMAFHYIKANHLFFYPEHRDHDPGHNGKSQGGGNHKGFGDVFPANTPYLVLSQGSSGSDRAFMNAVAQTLAAFHPQVKSKLAEKGMLMPTVQMILRSCNKQVETPADYLTGKAHPTVFDGKQLNPLKMIRMAHAMKPDSLPPLALIRMVTETESILGRDYFDVAKRERFLDTPCAIGRIVKSSKYMRRMVVNAEQSIDANGKPLEFEWKVLRGDAKRIQIKKLNASGSQVELLIPYHQRSKIAPGSEMESNRVDIGVFANNGAYFSPPSFVSLFYLDNERRVYDDQQRILVVDYTDPSVLGNYVDPLIDLRKDWRDDYRYDANGKLLGWTRSRGDIKQQFNALGELIKIVDSESTTVKVRYVGVPDGKGSATLGQVDAR